MKIVIKVGTQSILAPDGTPFEPVMLALVEEIACLQKAGHHVVLVSSGAVGSGRKSGQRLLGAEYGSSIAEKQVLASIGQPVLMQNYAQMFKRHEILAAQILLTKQDFQTRQHYLNIARLLREILERKNIVPIINENDSVAIEELMFTDNDELAGLIAGQMNADKLIILSNVQGVYSGDPGSLSALLISIIDPAQGWPEVSLVKSPHGKGGMFSKLETAKKMSILGITTHITKMQEGVIQKILAGESLGTTILPRKKKSSIKRWMAFNADKQAGKVEINSPLEALLKDNQRAISILPIGVMHAKGDFKKGDLVEVVNRQGDKIAIGIAKYDIHRLNEYIGKKDMPEFIHYDHLHIF